MEEEKYYVNKGIITDKDGKVVKDMNNGGTFNKPVTVSGKGSVGFSLKNKKNYKVKIEVNDTELKDDACLFEFGNEKLDDIEITIKNSEVSGNSCLFNFKE